MAGALFEFQRNTRIDRVGEVDAAGGPFEFMTELLTNTYAIIIGQLQAEIFALIRGSRR